MPLASERLRLLLHTDRPEALEARVRDGFPDVDVVSCGTYAGLPEALRDMRPEIVFSAKFEPKPYPAAAVLASPGIRWIHIGGTGVDHFVPWPPSIVVTNSAGAPATAMAEYVIGAIYAINHRLPAYLRAQLEREWRPEGIRVTAGGTIAVVGLGRVGRAICVRARSAGLNVLGVRSHPEPVAEADEVFSTGGLAEALGRADYVAVVVPRIPSTLDLLSRDAMAALKPGAVLVDVSRGGVVNETALIEALKDGRLRGAVLDVFSTEPLPPDNPLWRMENVVVTPHIAGFFDGWEAAAADIFCENLDRWRAGRPLLNRVDPERGY
jgi:phosphoglycerate dehydrogenase-like enzyme